LVYYGYHNTDSWSRYEIRSTDPDGSNGSLLYSTDSLPDPQPQTLAAAPDGDRVYFTYWRVSDDGGYFTGIAALPMTGGDPIVLRELSANDGSSVDSNSLSVSADGRTIAYETHDADGNGTIELMRPDGSEAGTIPVSGFTAIWAAKLSPDAQRVAFYGESEQGNGLYVANSDGSDATLIKPNPTGDGWVGVDSWTPDSQWLYTDEASGTTDDDFADEISLLNPTTGAVHGLTTLSWKTDFLPDEFPIARQATKPTVDISSDDATDIFFSKRYGPSVRTRGSG
jgi:hypothetical protein